jgi:hypothetical protein
LRQVNAVHRERLQESESRAHSLEARAERESAEIQQLTHLAMSMQKTLEAQQAQVTLLSSENLELKLRLEAAAATASIVGTGVRNERASTASSLSPIRGWNQVRKRPEKKKERSARARGAAAAAASGARHASRINFGGGESRREALRWDDDDSEEEVEEEEGEEEERAGSQHFKSAVNRHPKEEMMGRGGSGVGEYSSGEDERVFDYHDVTVLDEGEEEEEEDVEMDSHRQKPLRMLGPNGWPTTEDKR